MRTKLLLTLILCVSFTFTYAQNERPYIDEFSLKLPVDGEQFYEQEVAGGAFSIKENVLQIYPNEKLFIEV